MTGYDVCRLLVGSLGTLGVIVQVTLRCEPRPAASGWWAVPGSGAEVLARAHRPTAVLVGPDTTWVLLEGFAEDTTAELARLGDATPTDPPRWPEGPWRGRISVRPGRVDVVVRTLADGGVDVLGEAGVGTVHVAATSAAGLEAAREVAHAEGGWLLREAGGGVDGFGVPLPNGSLLARIKDALDPTGKCNPGRLPLGGRVASAGAVS